MADVEENIQDNVLAEELKTQFSTSKIHIVFGDGLKLYKHNLRLLCLLEIHERS